MIRFACSLATAATLAALSACASAPAEPQTASAQHVNEPAQCVTGSNICRRGNAGTSNVVQISGDSIRKAGGVIAPDKGVTPTTIADPVPSN